MEAWKQEATSPANSSLRFQTASHLSFTPSATGGATTYVCYDPQQAKYFHFGPFEYEVFQLLASGLSPSEVLNQLATLGIEWTEKEILLFVQSLLRLKLVQLASSAPQNAPVVGNEKHGPNARGTPIFPASALTRGLGFLVCPRLPLFHADTLASIGSRYGGWLFSRAGLLLWTLSTISALMLFWSHRIDFDHSLQQLLAPQTWPLMFAIWWGVKLAHELGHATAAKRLGVEVGEAGILFFMLAPVFFVDVTDAWKLRQRKDRMVITLAGIYVELLLASCAIWFAWFVPNEQLQHFALQVALIAGPGTILVNANPFLRLDGYYAFGDLLSIPNLRMHGRRLLGGWLECIFLGRASPKSFLDPWRTWVASLHAVCSICMQVIWMSGMIVAATYFAQGFGMLLALAAVILWVVAPLVIWLHSLQAAEDWSTVRPRLIVLTTLTAFLIGAAGSIPSPLGRTVPVVIQYHDPQLARSAVDGFVKAVHVRLGQEVREGDLLVEMDDPELRVRREQVVLESAAVETRIGQLGHQKNQAMIAAERQRLMSLAKQLAELDRQIAALQVRAIRDGTVVSPLVENLLHRFIPRGGVLLSVAREEQKEILASIAAADLESYDVAVQGARASDVRLRGGLWIQAIPALPKPRMSDVIPHPALSASAGGPLPVVLTSDSAERESPRTSLPRSQSTFELDAETSQGVYAGQQGVMFIGDSRSLWHRALDHFIQWFHDTP